MTVQSDPKEMEKQTLEYFEKCKEEGRRPTKPGLALHLGYESRQSLWYAKKNRGDEFKRVIVMAHSMIEDYLLQQNEGMCIYQLKSYFGLMEGDNLEADQGEQETNEAYL